MKADEIVKNGIKAFSVPGRAYYASILPKKDIIHIGHYAKDGGCYGEFSIEWDDIGLPLKTARLKVFNDGWLSISLMPELISELAKHDSVDVVVDDIVKMLLKLGYKDITRYKDEG